MCPGWRASILITLSSTRKTLTEDGTVVYKDTYPEGVRDHKGDTDHIPRGEDAMVPDFNDI